MDEARRNPADSQPQRNPGLARPVSRRRLLAGGGAAAGLAVVASAWASRGPSVGGSAATAQRPDPVSPAAGSRQPTTSTTDGPVFETTTSMLPDGALLEVPALPEAGPEPPVGHRYDVVIRNGRVIDPETGFDALVNVGIDDGRITSISDGPLRGRTFIDARDRIVAPGFIDLLSYEPNDFGAWLKLADGVTTNLAMHGVSTYADGFFDRYSERSPVHFGGAFHHHYFRGYEMGIGIEQRLSGSQADSLERLRREGLEGGFAGAAFSLEYAPGTSNDEVERLVAVTAEYGHVSYFHLRFSDPDPPGTSLESLAEVMSIAQRHDASIHVQHLTSTGGTFVMPDAVSIVNQARASGIDVTACVYPYDFWATFLASARFDAGWQDRYRITYENLQIAGTDEHLTEASFGRARAANKLVAALGSIPEQEVQQALLEPWVLVASDAIPTVGLNNHPRGAGTFARTIGRYVRDLGLLDLRSGLAKMTIQPALRVQAMIPEMRRKGRMQRGADADIVIFDPATIQDSATVVEPGLPSVGVDWVLVDGQVALRRGFPQRDVLAGRALRSVV